MWPISTQLLLAALICFAAAPQLTVSATEPGLCGECSTENKCPDDMFCCPFQLHCIPMATSSCLCPNKGSSKSLLHNNERVWKGETNCDGIKCEFCPDTVAPENTCQTDKDLCFVDGVEQQQTFCVEGDHCSCSGEYVCSDTKTEGECASGTGGYVHCENKADTSAAITRAATTTTAATVTTVTQDKTCQECAENSDCPDDFYCCPNQLLCIPTSHSSCLCPDKTSQKSEFHNNARVFKGETDCDGELCEFCPGLDPPQNTCNAQGQDTPCRSAGATSDQGYCVYGDHCKCMNGFVCSDTSRSGECGHGTGGYVHCVTEPETTPKVEVTTVKQGNVARNDSAPATVRPCVVGIITIVGMYM